VDDDLFTAWLQWLEELKGHLHVLHHHRDMWKQVTDRIFEIATTEMPNMPATWVNHYTRVYVDSAAIAVRRLIRSGGVDTITLGRLLESITGHPDPLSREAFTSRWMERHEDDDPVWKGEWARFAGHAYDRWDDGHGQLNLKIVRRDKQDLNAVAARVLDLADESIAHITDKPRPAVTFRELNGAIDHTGRIFIRYGALLTGTEYQLIPVVDENWKLTFYRPLFSPPPGWRAGDPAG
jgi:hypothetical protein